MGGELCAGRQEWGPWGRGVEHQTIQRPGGEDQERRGTHAQLLIYLVLCIVSERLLCMFTHAPTWSIC